MSETRAQLRSSLVARYKQLRERLTARLGSQDLAGEALHEMWLKLQDGPDLKPVADSDAYLYRAALNTASNLKAKGGRLLATVDIETILHLADEAPDQERVLIAKNELDRLRKALNQLSPRQRDIFVRSFSGEMSHEALAERYGVSVRTIQIELRNAVLHYAQRTGRGNLFALGALRVSKR
jgi:RNA polymerase sigma factor (sigma-70 family)